MFSPGKDCNRVIPGPNAGDIASKCSPGNVTATELQLPV